MSGHMDVRELLSLLQAQDTDPDEVKDLIHDNLNQSRDSSFLYSLVDFYLNTNNKRCLEILVGVRDPHDRHLFDKMTECLRNSSQKLNALSLLGHVVRRQPSWLHHIAKHPLLSSLFRVLKTDTDIPILVTSLLILITLLPMIPHKIGTMYLQDVFETFGRLTNIVAKRPGNVPDVFILHLHMSVYALFHKLYGMFPCNFLAFMRAHYSSRDNLSVFTETVRPMLEKVRMHPLLVTANKEAEVSTTRWKQMEPHDIVVECARISLDPVEGCREDPLPESSVIKSTTLPRLRASHPHVGAGFPQHSLSVVPVDPDSVVGQETQLMLQNSIGGSGQVAQTPFWSPAYTCGLSTPPRSHQTSPVLGASQGTSGGGVIPSWRDRAKSLDPSSFSRPSVSVSPGPNPTTPSHVTPVPTPSLPASPRKQDPNAPPGYFKYPPPSSMLEVAGSRAQSTSLGSIGPSYSLDKGMMMHRRIPLEKPAEVMMVPRSSLHARAPSIPVTETLSQVARKLQQQKAEVLTPVGTSFDEKGQEASADNEDGGLDASRMLRRLLLTDANCPSAKTSEHEASGEHLTDSASTDELCPVNRHRSYSQGGTVTSGTPPPLAVVLPHPPLTSGQSFSCSSSPSPATNVSGNTFPLKPRNPAAVRKITFTPDSKEIPIEPLSAGTNERPPLYPLSDPYCLAARSSSWPDLRYCGRIGPYWFSNSSRHRAFTIDPGTMGHPPPPVYRHRHYTTGYDINSSRPRELQDPSQMLSAFRQPYEHLFPFALPSVPVQYCLQCQTYRFSSSVCQTSSLSHFSTGGSGHMHTVTSSSLSVQGACSSFSHQPSPSELLDRHIHLSCDIYQREASSRSGQPQGRPVSYPSGAAVGRLGISDEVCVLQGQLLLMHNQLLYERHKRDIHAERNRRLSGKARKAKALEEQNSSIQDQLQLQEQDIMRKCEEIQKLKQERKRIIEEKEQATSHTQEQIRRLTEEMAQLHDSLEKYQSQIEADRKEKDEMRRELQHTQWEKFNLERDLEHIQERVAQNDRLKAEVDRLSKEVLLHGEFYQKYTEQQRKMHYYQKHEVEMDSMQKAYSHEIEVLRMNLRLREIDLEAARSRATEVESSLSKKDTVLSDQRHTLRSLKEDQEYRCKALEDKYTAVKATVQQLEAYIVELTAKVEQGNRNGSGTETRLRRRLSTKGETCRMTRPRLATLPTSHSAGEEGASHGVAIRGITKPVDIIHPSKIKKKPTPRNTNTASTTDEEDLPARAVDTAQRERRVSGKLTIGRPKDYPCDETWEGFEKHMQQRRADDTHDAPQRYVEDGKSETHESGDEEVDDQPASDEFSSPEQKKLSGALESITPNSLASLVDFHMSDIESFAGHADGERHHRCGEEDQGVIG